MKKHSAGLVVFRRTDQKVEVLLAHMGSPWWAKKDIGAWTIPKGGIEDGETPFDTAKREFSEELGLPVPQGKFIELGDIEQDNNKIVTAWAVEADIDVTKIKSNIFEIQWPPKSGKTESFPEIDHADWFSIEQAAQKTVKGQAELFEKLAEALNVPYEPVESPQQSSLF